MEKFCVNCKYYKTYSCYHPAVIYINNKEYFDIVTGKKIKAIVNPGTARYERLSRVKSNKCTEEGILFEEKELSLFKKFIKFLKGIFND